MTQDERTVAVQVLVDDDHQSLLDRVADDLRQAGMEVRQQLAFTGVITGVVPESQVDRLNAVPGVETVERTQGFQLPPPDSPVQ
jgi:hypothetical protein